MELTEILIGGIEVISKILAEWTSLCEEGASNHPFLRPEWFTAFVNNFDVKIMLLAVWRGQRLRAVLPLERKSGTLHGVPVRKLQAVFNLNSQRFDLVHGSDETQRKAIIAAIWKQIKSLPGWQVVEMRLVDSDSWLKDLLALAEKENFRTGVWKMDSSPFVSLDRSANREKLIEEYSNGLSKKRRQDLNRRLRRLKEQGDVKFVISREYSAELMQKFFEMELRGWKGRSGTAAINDLRVENLHDDFARAVALGNALFFYELKLDGKTIAMQIRVKYDKNTVCWKTAYDEDYAKFSPGNLLFREFLNECIRNDTVEIDLLCPSTASKKFWASGERQLVGFYVFQRGLTGFLLWKWKFGVVSGLRRFKNRAQVPHAK